MSSSQLKRIQKHEVNLNQIDTALNQLEQALQDLKRLHPGFKALMDYYHSEAWSEDVALSEKADFPNIPCGVLSQDAIYDLYQKQRQIHFQSIHSALAYLEE